MGVLIEGPGVLLVARRADDSTIVGTAQLVLDTRQGDLSEALYASSLLQDRKGRGNPARVPLQDRKGRGNPARVPLQ